MLQKDLETGPRESHEIDSAKQSLEDSAVVVQDSSDYASLANHELFRDIPLNLVAPVLAECPVQYLQQDEILISPGEENHHLYLLVSGRLQVYLNTIDSQISFPIDPGECIGEMSIIESRLTSAFVVAEEASSLVVLPEDLFWEKIVRLPGAVRNLLRMLSQRMRKHNEVTRQTLEQQLRYEHLQKELEAAGKIQANILPQDIPLFPNHPQIDVCALIEPAKEVGGDFFDAFAVDHRHIYIAVGDVSGKGMPAALFMVRVMTLLRMSLSKQSNFGSLLSVVNRILCENNDDCMFVTLFVGLLDVTTGKLIYMNGGHNPPFLSSNGKLFKLLQLPKGIVLGISEHAHYEVAELTMQPGDTLVLYTDGVTEAGNAQQEFFSVERTRDILAGSAGEDITTIVKTLQDAVAQFSKGLPQADDITILTLRYLGNSTP